MKTIKYILMIVFLIPQVTEAVYRVYSGTMGDNKVEFYLLATPDSDFDIIYIKDNTYEVEYIGGPQKKESDYYFKNYTTMDTVSGKDTLIIKNFDFSLNKVQSESNYLLGYSETFGDFKLKKEFEYNVFTENGYELNRVESKQLFDNTEFENIEFLQRSSTKDFYFKVLSSKEKEDYIKIIGINIHSKKNGELLQSIKSLKGYPFQSFNALQIGDFDFDGNENDFFLQNAESHADNVQQIYYIYDESQNKYIEANLEGYSIQFDPEKKTATSTKTCGDVYVDPMFIKLNKQYLFNKNKKNMVTKINTAFLMKILRKNLFIKNVLKKKDWIAKKLW